MAYRGYILKFKFNVARDTNYMLDHDSIYYQTVEISLHMRIQKEGFITYEEVEAQVNRHLQFYSGRRLNVIPPFDSLEPTLENIAKVFYHQLKFILSTLYFDLFRLEVREKSTRVFSVSEVLPASTEQGMKRVRKLNRLMAKNKAKNGEEHNPEDWQGF